METKFNFKSQICTSKSQSETLLKLGLKQETADMCYTYCNYSDRYELECRPPRLGDIPAWSLHRLIEMMPRKIECEVENGLSIDLFHTDYDGVTYYEVIGYYTDKNLYNAVISCITDLIKEGYFNKEYLAEQAGSSREE